MDHAVLNELNSILELSQSANNDDQQQVTRRMATLQEQRSDFILYALYIFTSKDRPDIVRQRAGLMIKQHTRTHLENISTSKLFQHVPTILQSLVESIRDPIKVVRETSGSVITFMIQRLGLPNTKDTIRGLTNSLVQTNDLELLDGAFSCLNKICEDACDAIRPDKDVMAGPIPDLVPEQKEFLDFAAQELLPKVMQFGNPQAPLACRQHAIQTVNYFALKWMFEEQPYSIILRPLLPEYRNMVGTLAQDNDTIVILHVIKAMNNLIAGQESSKVLDDKVSVVLRFMLTHCENSDENIRQSACNFWYTPALTNYYSHEVEPLLPELVPVLLRNLKYSEADYRNMFDPVEEEGDDAKDIAPRTHAARRRGGEEDEEGDDDGIPNAWGHGWTARKGAAASIDCLSHNYPQQIIDIVLPLVGENLESPDWEIKECAVLTMGAISNGCGQQMEPHLPNVMRLLVGKTVHADQPLLRTISCWCISRYGSWVCQNQEVFEEVLKVFLMRMKDNSKRVQEAACSSFANLCEASYEGFGNYIPAILETLVACFNSYKQKNLYVLYDCTSAFIRNVRYELRTDEYMNVLVPALMLKIDIDWQDRLTVAHFECLMACCEELGDYMSHLAPRIVEKCGTIIQGVLEQEKRYAQHKRETNGILNGVVKSIDTSGDEPDRDILGTALDLLSSLTDCLGQGIAAILKEKNFVQVLPQIICANNGRGFSPQVQQSAFALMGESAKFAFDYLIPVLPQLLEAAKGNIVGTPEHWIPAPVANNAGWAIGEISAKAEPTMLKAYAYALAEKLVYRIEQQYSYHDASMYYDDASMYVRVNCCLTLGRLASVNPDEVLPLFPRFVEPWLMLISNTNGDQEKAKSFIGFCNCIERQSGLFLEQKDNRTVPTNMLKLFVVAVAKFYPQALMVPPEDLRLRVANILRVFRDQVSRNDWDNFFYRIQPAELTRHVEEKFLGS